MDFCRNISVSGGLPSAEYHEPAEQVLSPSCCKLGNSLDDLFHTHSNEGDVSLEWLSVFVEDCLSSTGNSFTPSVPVPVPVPLPTNTTPNPSKPMPLGKLTKQNTYTFPLNKLTVPGKARSKRRRCPTAKVKASFTSWSSHLNPNYQTLQFTCSEPPLLQQAYWLADSELILPKKENTTNTNTITSTKEIRNCKSDEQVVVETKEEIEIMMGKESLGSIEASSGIIEGGFGSQNQQQQLQQQQQQQPRRCSHCMAQRTPQWRAGPMGPKTLCNACGVRYKSGRLLPEYRPAKSPTFVSYKHSNSHKKVLEMRMALLSSNT